MKIDHILLRVTDLEKAVDNFERMGFTVYYGGLLPSKSYNAMIYFENGSFLELVDTSRFPAVFKWVLKRRFFCSLIPFLKRVSGYLNSSSLLIDYCVHSTSIETTYARIKSDFDVSSLKEFKRKNHKQDKLKWQLFTTTEKHLPFVISDYRPYKIPEPLATVHKNGVYGITALTFSSQRNYAEQLSQLRIFYQQKPEILSKKHIRFKLENATLNYIIGLTDGIKSITLSYDPSSPFKPESTTDYPLLFEVRG